MCFIASSADIDVSLVTKQRARTSFIAQKRRVLLDVGTGQFDPLTCIGQKLSQRLRRRGSAGFIRPAEEEDATLINGAASGGSKILLRCLHCALSASRRVSATWRTIRSATSRARFSSAVCSAAMVAYSDETTSIPASEPDVASSRIAPLARSTS